MSLDGVQNPLCANADRAIADRRDRKAATHVELGQLADADSTVDVTKLLLAYALRIGAVEQTSWSDLIDVVLRRPSRQVLWKNGSSPVFHGKTKGGHLDFSKPAPSGQQLIVVRRAAELIGMLDVPIAHDLRRGAAADLSQVKLSSSTDAVAKVLTHTATSMNKGLTASYMGRLKQDTWADRVQKPSVKSANATVDGDAFGLMQAPQPFKKRKLDSRDVERYCDDNDLDENTISGRQKAHRALRKLQRETWQSGAQNALHEPVRPALKDVTNITTAPSTTSTTPALDGRCPKLDTMETAPAHQGSVVDGNIDPRLRVFSQALGLDTDASATGQDETDLAVNAMLRDTYDLTQPVADEDTGPSVLVGGIDAFLECFSTINKLAISTSTLPADVERGNSREPPTQFLFACDRCPREFISLLRLRQHQANCGRRLQSAMINVSDDGAPDLDDVQIDRADGFDEAPTAPPAFARDDDEEAFDVATQATAVEDEPAAKSKAKGKAKSTKGVVDPGFPKRCPDSSICGVTKSFANARNLKQHRTSYHDDEWPDSPCNVPGCHLPPTHLFPSRASFRKHLLTAHFLNDQDGLPYINQILPQPRVAAKGTSQNFTATTCLVPQCRSEKEFAEYRAYTIHLRQVHQLQPKDYPKYMPWNSTAIGE